MKEPKEKNTPNNSSPSLSPTPSKPIPIPQNAESPPVGELYEISLADPEKPTSLPNSLKDALHKLKTGTRTKSATILKHFNDGKKKNANGSSNSPTTNHQLRFSLSDIGNLFSHDSELPDSKHPNINSSPLTASRKIRGSWSFNFSANSPPNENTSGSDSSGSENLPVNNSSPLVGVGSTNSSCNFDLNMAEITEAEALSLGWDPDTSSTFSEVTNPYSSPNSTVIQSTALGLSDNESEIKEIQTPQNGEKNQQQQTSNTPTPSSSSPSLLAVDNSYPSTINSTFVNTKVSSMGKKISNNRHQSLSLHRHHAAKRPNKRSKPSSSWPSFSHKFDTYVDSGAIKVAESSPKYMEAISCVFASISLVSAYFEPITLVVPWSYLNAANSFLIGISQLSDERKHRRTMQKLKGLTNIANAVQLATLPGIPALAASFGLSFIQSLEELKHRWECWHNPQYWYEDAKSERALLQEQLTRLRSIERNTTTKSGFFYNQLQDNNIVKLNARIRVLNDYIREFDRTSILHPEVRPECYKDLIEALLNTITQGIAFASIVMVCVMPITEPPVYLCIIAVVALTAAKYMGLVETFAHEAAELMVGENVVPVTSPFTFTSRA